MNSETFIIISKVECFSYQGVIKGAHMTIVLNARLSMSNPRDRLTKALTDNIGNYTISRDGQVSSKRDVIHTAFVRELDNLDATVTIINSEENTESTDTEKVD